MKTSVSMLLQYDYGGKSLPVHIHLDYLQRPPQRVCEVIGDQGKVRYDYYTNEIVLNETSTNLATTYRFNNFDRNQMFIDELQHFLACIRGEEQSLIDLREGIRSMKIGLAADNSLKTGNVVQL